MLGGVKLTQQTLAHAEEMLGTGTLLHWPTPYGHVKQS
jgi:hypothetical protein